MLVLGSVHHTCYTIHQTKALEKAEEGMHPPKLGGDDRPILLSLMPQVIF